MNSNNNNHGIEIYNNFRQQAGKAGESVFPFYKYWSEGKINGSRKLLGMFIQELQYFENFLDEAGARVNKKWFYFSELVASMRNLSIVSYILYHSLHRYDHYKIGEIENISNDFADEATPALDFINESIKNLFKACREEAKKLNISIKEGMLPKRKHIDMFFKEKLPADYECNQMKGEKEKVLSLVRKLRKAAKMSKVECFGHKYSYDELMELVPLKIDEKKARKLKNIVHAVQSDYDTYVKNTVLESENPQLRELRRISSIPLHLLEAARWLSHFYERHESNICSNNASDKLAELIDRKKVLDIVVNFLLYYSDYFLQKGNTLAENIMSAYAEKVQYELSIPKPLGFHARPSTYVSLIVNEHGTDVEMIVDSKRYNAKSVINLLMAAGYISEKGYQKVIFEGDKRVLDDLKILSENNYCEDQKIPPELNYLRILRNMPSH